MVNGQPVKELRKALLALGESNLKALQDIQKRTLGVDKLLSDENYVPSSVRTNPTLYYPEELKQDKATIGAEAEFNEQVKNNNTVLAKIIRGQAVRNNNQRINKHQGKVIMEMILLGAHYVSHQREKCRLLASETNNDTLAKGTVINFIDAVGWLDEFQPPIHQKLLYHLFPPKSSQNDDEWAKETKNFVKKLCSGTKDTNGKEKWEILTHGNDREIERKRFINEWKEKPEDESIDNENEKELSSQLNSPNRSNERKIIRQFINQNRNTYQRSKPRQSKSPYKLWLDMEKHAQANEKAFQLNSASKAEKEDRLRLLSDQVFFWFVEIFPRLLGTPFSVMVEQSKKNRAEAMLQASFEKESSHDLAKEIKNRLPRRFFSCCLFKFSRKIFYGFGGNQFF